MQIGLAGRVLSESKLCAHRLPWSLTPWGSGSDVLWLVRAMHAHLPQIFQVWVLLYPNLLRLKQLTMCANSPRDRRRHGGRTSSTAPTRRPRMRGTSLPSSPTPRRTRRRRCRSRRHRRPPALPRSSCLTPQCDTAPAAV